MKSGKSQIPAKYHRGFVVYPVKVTNESTTAIMGYTLPATRFVNRPRPRTRTRPRSEAIISRTSTRTRTRTNIILGIYIILMMCKIIMSIFCNVTPIY